MIKAAFFDVDGTLLSHRTKQIPPSTREAVALLRSRGIRCIAATGRQIHELDKLPMGDMIFDGYITMNGQMTLDADRNVLYGTPLEGEAKEYALKLFREKKVPVIFVETDRFYINAESQRATDVQADISSKVPPADIYCGGEIYQACVFITREEEELLAPVAGKCVVTRWHPRGVDVIAPNGGKRTAVERYCREQNWNREEIIAFGDSENDMAMIQYAGIGVAMGNAEEQVKAVADYVTADIDDDGVVKALNHFGLI